MSIVGDVLAALKQINEWNELQALPKRVEALEQKMLILERRSEDNPGNARCEHCGSLEVKITGSRESTHRFGRLGVRDIQYTCQERACGRESWIMDLPNRD